MKSLLIPITIFFLTSVLVSCSDSFTDLEPIGSSTYSNYWQTDQDAEQAANALYAYMQGEEMFSRGFFWYINASDDMVTGRTKAAADNIKNFVTDGNDGYSYDVYSHCYAVIRRANDILYNVPDMDIDDDLKSRILGEAYFMRGFNYFWLSHTYGDYSLNGGVPIVTEDNMNDAAGSFTRPESVVDNFEQIVSDLSKAAQLLPLVTEYASDDLGRAHKDAAYGYLAKTYLYWAEYDDSKYALAASYCDSVTNSGSGRALVDTDTPDEDYRILHSHLSDWSSEYVWSVVSGVNDGSKLPGIVLELTGWAQYNGWGYFHPTNDLYEEFEDDDPRREVTMLKFGDEFIYFGDTMQYYSENSQTGFMFNKYMYEFQDADAVGTDVNTNGDAPCTTYDVPLLRYAEILLIKAEALIMQGQSGDEPLNQVRDRAGLSAISGATLDDLKHERRVELAGEFANRHYDLVRWGDAATVYAQPLYGRIHEDKSDPESAYSVEQVWAGRTFESYMHCWPIPATIISNSGILQNEGW